MIRALGCDPGSIFGLCLIQVEDSLSITTAKMLDATVLRRRDGAGGEIDQDLEIWDRLRLYALAHRPDLVAIEEPAESKIIYRGHHRQRTETSFRSGVYYGLALTAFASVRLSMRKIEIASYPAVNSKNRGRGWMGSASRKKTIATLTTLLKAIRAPSELLELDKDGDFKRHHVADALGVLNFHLDEERTNRAIVRATRPTWRRPDDLSRTV